jgi:tetratricopeptide (TPR) repeat protein
MRPGAAFLLWVTACCAAAPGSRCLTCHPKIVTTYAQTGMARSVATAGENIPGISANGRVRFFHQASNRWYTLYRRDGAAYLRRHQDGIGGTESNVIEARIDYVLGSGNHARGLIHRAPDGRLMQLPVAWYTEDRQWSMAPGYDRRDHADFRREVDGACMFCHNAYPDPAFPAELPQGIACERCHGPGDEHARTGKPAAILNPARLSLDRQMEICMQCHLQPTSLTPLSIVRRDARSVFSYDPREPLGSYMIFFDRSPRAESFEVNHAAYGLRDSACFRASGGRLVCTTCHNPHEVTRMNTVERACRSCHSMLGRGHTTDGGCASCHMAKRRAEDAVHVIMTDHRIRRRPQTRQPLQEAHETYQGKMRLYYPAGAMITTPPVNHTLSPAARLNYLGTIHQQKGELDKSAGVLRQAIALAPELPEPHLNLGVTLSRQGRVEAAEAAFREAIRMAPDLAAAHNNLAYLLAARDDVREAEFHFAEAVRLDPNYWAAHLGYARLLAAAGRREEAVAHFRQAARSPEESMRREALAALESR